MNKILVEKNCEKEIYLDSNEDKYIYVLEENASLKVFNFSSDQSFKVEIYLKGENASVEYFFSTINFHDNTYNIKVYHEANNTKSNLVNHGVNVYDKKLNFVVDGIINKDTVGCSCTQDNKIMNLEDGKSKIEPNLLIDSFDSIANHAAYIGNFREEDLFYLKSRGISQSIATKMLTRGFLIHNNPNLEKIGDFLKQIEKL